MNNIILLNKKFDTIKNEWKKSMRPGTSGIGYTFEQLIGKCEDNFPIADYNGIEIKTVHNYIKNKKIHLFNATPDGEYLYPIKEILEKLGYPDKNDKTKKVFNVDVNAKEYKKIGYYKKIKLEVDRNNSKLKLIAKDNYNNTINLNISWSFKLLEERLNMKLQTLAIVKANTIIKNKIEYFKYTNINYYKLNSFESFINAIEEGKISITFKIGYYKTGERTGKIHDRGTSFDIMENDLVKIYQKIFSHY